MTPTRNSATRMKYNMTHVYMSVCDHTIMDAGAGSHPIKFPTLYTCSMDLIT